MSWSSLEGDAVVPNRPPAEYRWSSPSVNWLQPPIPQSRVVDAEDSHCSGLHLHAQLLSSVQWSLVSVNWLLPLLLLMTQLNATPISNVECSESIQAFALNDATRFHTKRVAFPWAVMLFRPQLASHPLRFSIRTLRSPFTLRLSPPDRLSRQLTGLFTRRTAVRSSLQTPEAGRGIFAFSPTLFPKHQLKCNQHCQHQHQHQHQHLCFQFNTLS